MGILVDAIVLLIFILNIIIGYKKGLINVIYGICAFIIAIILTLALYKPISNVIINNTQINNRIKEAIIYRSAIEEDEKEEEKNSNMIKKYIDTKVKETADNLKKKSIETLADMISVRIVDIITGITLFVVIRIILIFLKYLFTTVAEIPIIKQLNEVGGIAYGILKGVIIIYLLLTIIFVVTSIKGDNIITDKIEESYITKFLYNKNIVVNYCLLDKNLL